jgi:hypothetical protein
MASTRAGPSGVLTNYSLRRSRSDMPSHHRPIESSLLAPRSRPWLAFVSVVVLACQGSDPGPTSLFSATEEARAAKTGGGGSTTVTVTSTNPPGGPRDTTLDVTINGSGFSRGAVAKWSLNGDTTLVHVAATRLVSSTQLVATVSVPATAPVASYDVQVTLSDGKKGVGAELFVVTLADPTITWKLPLADAALAFRSDRQFSDGTHSVYANGVCAVKTWVEMSATDPFPGFGHLSLGSSNKGQCARSLKLFYPDGTTEMAGGVTQRGLTEPRIAQGATVLRTLALLGAARTSRCGRVLFGEGSQGAGVGSDSVLVTRLDMATWRVRSNGDRNRALCENTNQLLHMPIDFVIVADDPSRFP